MSAGLLPAICYLLSAICYLVYFDASLSSPNAIVESGRVAGS